MRQKNGLNFLEFKAIRQDRNGFKRFFYNEYFHIYVWYDQTKEQILGFQIIFLSSAFTWTFNEGFSLSGVNGLDHHIYLGSPILEGEVDKNIVNLEKEILLKTTGLEKKIEELIIEKMNEYIKLVSGSH